MDGWEMAGGGSTCAREKGGGRAGEYSFDAREQSRQGV